MALTLWYSLYKAFPFHSVEQPSNRLILSMGNTSYLGRNQGAWVISAGPEHQEILGCHAYLGQSSLGISVDGEPRLANQDVSGESLVSKLQVIIRQALALLTSFLQHCCLSSCLTLASCTIIHTRSRPMQLCLSRCVACGASCCPESYCIMHLSCDSTKRSHTYLP